MAPFVTGVAVRKEQSNCASAKTWLVRLFWSAKTALRAPTIVTFGIAEP